MCIPKNMMNVKSTLLLLGFALIGVCMAKDLRDFHGVHQHHHQGREERNEDQIDSDKVWDAVKREALLRILTRSPTRESKDDDMLLTKREEIPLSRLAYSLNDIIDELIKHDEETQNHKHSANKKTIHKHDSAKKDKIPRLAVHHHEQEHREKETKADEDSSLTSKDLTMKERKRQSARPFINTRWGDSGKIKNEHAFDDLLELSYT